MGNWNSTWLVEVAPNQSTKAPETICMKNPPSYTTQRFPNCFHSIRAFFLDEFFHSTPRTHNRSVMLLWLKLGMRPICPQTPAILVPGGQPWTDVYKRCCRKTGVRLRSGPGGQACLWRLQPACTACWVRALVALVPSFHAKVDRKLCGSGVQRKCKGILKRSTKWKVVSDVLRGHGSGV